MEKRKVLPALALILAFSPACVSIGGERTSCPEGEFLVETTRTISVDTSDGGTNVYRGASVCLNPELCTVDGAGVLFENCNAVPGRDPFWQVVELDQE